MLFAHQTEGQRPQPEQADDRLNRSRAKGIAPAGDLIVVQSAPLDEPRPKVPRIVKVPLGLVAELDEPLLAQRRDPEPGAQE